MFRIRLIVYCVFCMFVFSVGAICAEPLDHAAFRVQNQTLESALATLAATFETPLVFDEKSLREANADWRNLPASCELHSAGFRQAAEQILSSHNLTCVERFGCQLVTTKQAATEQYFDTRVYQLRKRMKVERRMQTIMWSAAPKSWLLTGGKGDAAAFSADKILIHQSAATQNEIADMFHKSVVQVHGGDPNQFHSATKLEQSLSKPATLNYRGKTLADAVAALSEANSIAIEMATNDLKSKIVPADMNQAPTLGGGLSLMLELIDPTITWEVKEEVVIVRNSADASAMQKVAYKLPKTVAPEEAQQLIEAIEYTIASDQWETVGGDATMSLTHESRQLVVEATYPVHRQVRRLLADLRAAKTPDQ